MCSTWSARAQFWLPVSLLPLVGGLGGAFFGVLFGYVTTRKAGTTFAMITLGIGEMVFASSLMFPDFFGGEGGVSTNRVVGNAVLGITYGPGRQVYYLIAVWCLLSMIAMYAWTQTPLGRIANAVRDNRRAGRVRWLRHPARTLPGDDPVGLFRRHFRRAVGHQL